MLFELSCQLLLIDHQLVKHRVVIHQISPLQLCIPLELPVVLDHIFYLDLQLLGLDVQIVEEIGFR